jgi:catechol 2,3-dioxygenase-like lactoylglutathione lyase family enzyme
VKVRSVRWVGIATTAYEEMVGLLRDVMGLRVNFQESATTELSTSEGDAVQVMAPGDRYFEFFGRYATGPVPLFEVDDVRAALRELEHADVEIVGTLDQDRVWEWIHFRAPDGNLYELASRRAAASDDRTTPSSSAPRVWMGYGGEGTWQDDLGRVTMASGTECAHSGCTCVTADEFCSDFCRGHGGEAHEHASTGGAGCGCGHPACGS